MKQIRFPGLLPGSQIPQPWGLSYTNAQGATVTSPPKISINQSGAGKIRLYAVESVTPGENAKVWEIPVSNDPSTMFDLYAMIYAGNATTDATANPASQPTIPGNVQFWVEGTEVGAVTLTYHIRRTRVDSLAVERTPFDTTWSEKITIGSMDDPVLVDENSGAEISNWISGADNPANVALIAAHTSATDPTPRMPHLILKAGPSSGALSYCARLDVDYTRGNGDKAHQTQDEEHVPDALNNHIVTTSGRIDFYELYKNHPFFGGTAIVHWQLMDGNGALVGDEKTIRFVIGGQNPDYDRCKAFIQAQPDSDDAGDLWFAYAIAKSEAREYGQNEGTHQGYFNQFARGRYAGWRLNSPTWNNDGDDSPGGYGMFQVTGNSSATKAIIPRTQIWNWRDGVRAGIVLLRSKLDRFKQWMPDQLAAATSSHPLPELNIIGELEPAKETRAAIYKTTAMQFKEGTNHRMSHVVAMKAYNGLRRVDQPGWTDPKPSPPGFQVDGEYESYVDNSGDSPVSMAHYCNWVTARGWIINRWKKALSGDKVNYLERICGQIDD